MSKESSKAKKLKELAIEQYPKLRPFKALLTYFVDNSILGTLNGPRHARSRRALGCQRWVFCGRAAGSYRRLACDDHASASDRSDGALRRLQDGSPSRQINLANHRPPQARGCCSRRPFRLDRKL
ncbi:hypothetical protein ACVIHI_003141 [Bradyrhizobium sp. USDA 4524]|nr:hypothetical protein [Bradyrhizobium sp. USDA 4538]MCP1904506.1 hypothetical protein [Bradyrhizobium sp. USDA 4537]MCP1989838.1 hypothetical protein [Bradyrhizobium sp. USDA 4539]